MSIMLAHINMKKTQPQIDLAQAERFLTRLGPDGQRTFQTFGDINKNDKTLSKILHGDLDQHSATLSDRNSRGAGVFIMVNEGNGAGRKTKNVKRVRAVFVDLDGAPLDPLIQAKLRPQITLESSPGRYHAYWLIDDLPVAAFSHVQFALAQRFNGDSAVKDLPRVMRLPGFIHQKSDPFMTHILTMDDAPPYKASDFLNAFNINLTVNAQAFNPNGRIEKGSRNDAIFQMANGFRNDGLPLNTALIRLQTANANRCDPPLLDTEVEDIWTRVSKFRPANSELASLFNNPELFGLSFPARWLYGIATSRSAGSSGSFSLTLKDCEEQGFTRRQRQHAIEELIAADLLTEVRPFHGGVGGGIRQCSLYILGVKLTPKL